MNFYEFSEKLKKQKLNESLLGMIGQNFSKGVEALGTSTNQGWQQIQNVQNMQQNRINAKSEKDIATHLSQVAKSSGVDPKELQQEIQAFVNKLNQVKAATNAAKPAADAPNPAPSDATTPPSGPSRSWSEL